MDKNAIKKYAIWARNELIAKVSQKALQYGISQDGWENADADEVNGIALSVTEKKQRKALIEQIQAKGYKNVIEEVAYTWFNRFVALRYMEVNNYLPSLTHVFSAAECPQNSEYDVFQPQILAEAMSLNLPGLDMDNVYAYKEQNKSEELFKYLLIVQCNALNDILPHMFQKLADYTELLLPDYLLRKGSSDGKEKGSVLNELVTAIPRKDWEDQVQIIGWLYQYYNTEPKDKVFADLKKNIKISKENIPAATQLFTPDWIVRYMVENSLGRLWLEVVGSGQCNSEQCVVDSEQSELHRYFTDKWKYYLEEAEQEPEVAEKLAELRKERAKMEPKDIKVIDPCMGSGHILVYAFDVLMEIYSKYGVNKREAVKSIIANNLYGLDIDQRAFQLAYFAVMMKGRQYDPRFFTRGAVPQVYAVEESNGLDKWTVVSGQWTENSEQWVVDSGRVEVSEAFIKLTDELIDTFHDAKEYGSLLEVNGGQWVVDRTELADVCLDADNDILVVTEELDKIKKHFAGDLFAEHDINLWCDGILDLAKQAKVMSQKYDVVVTNPPYMGLASGDKKINEYVKKNYPDSKTDLYAVFIEKCGETLQDNGYQAMITQQSWMFLSSFEKLRKKILKKQIVNMTHLGTRAFDEIGGEVVQTTSFVLGNNSADKYKGTYARLIEANSEIAKQEMFLNGENRFVVAGDNFEKIHGSPVAYWVSDNFIKMFSEGYSIDTVSDFTGSQHITADNNKFLRYFWEVEKNDIGQNRNWAFYSKGGEYRKWYGNLLLIVNTSSDAMLFYKNNSTSNLLADKYWFTEGITYSAVTIKGTGFRYLPPVGAFDKGGATICYIDDLEYYIALLNTIVSSNIFKFFNPTINLQVKDIKNLPIIYKKEYKEIIKNLSCDNVTLSRIDWDTFETSWDFKVNPLVASYNMTNTPFIVGGKDIRKGTFTLEEHYQTYKTNTNGRFRQLKENEEELNEIFIEIYGLQDELTPKVANKDVTIAFIFDTKEDILESFKGNNYVLTREDVIKNLISYAVGCMFGRYSTNPQHYGLVYAGGEFSDQYLVISEQCYLKEEVVKCVIAELQRTDSLAESYGLSDGSLQLSKKVTERGDVCSIGSDEKGSSVNTIEYSRGAGSEFNERVYTLSVNSKGIKGGDRDTIIDLCSPEVLAAIGSGDCSKLISRGWKDAGKLNWQAIFCSLTTDHYSLSKDAIIPICTENYLDDDITTLFMNWLKLTFGEAHFEENLTFIANSLSTKGNTSREVIRNYFLNEFYKDHVKKYQKRPIYWLFDSGKNNGFKALIYMHRYKSDTVARIRTDYVHELQARYRTAIENLEQQIAGETGRSNVKLKSKLKALKAQADEAHAYEEKIHHLADQMISIDLDDGVKVNYAKFQEVLAKIK